MQKIILIVDYEHKSIEEIQQFLKDEDVTFLTAYDGRQALEVFETKNPDLVLMSALLPKINGFDLCKRITSGELGEVRPVIIFSGIYKADKYRKEAVIGCGAIDFLEKPLSKWKLLNVIKSSFEEIPQEPANNQIKTQAHTTLAKCVSGSADTGIGPRSLFRIDDLTGDLLEIDALLDQEYNIVLGSNSLLEKEVLDMLTTEPDPLLISSSDNVETQSPEQESTAEARPLLSSPQDDNERESVRDDFRIDLDLETRMRDQQISRELAAECYRDGQNIVDILELGTRMGSAAENSPTKSSKKTKIIELDTTSLEPALDQVSTGTRNAPTESAAMQQDDGPNVVRPSLTIRFQESSRRVPLFAMVLVLLLVILFFWLAVK